MDGGVRGGWGGGGAWGGGRGKDEEEVKLQWCSSGWGGRKEGGRGQQRVAGEGQQRVSGERQPPYQRRTITKRAWAPPLPLPPSTPLPPLPRGSSAACSMAAAAWRKHHITRPLHPRPLHPSHSR